MACLASEEIKLASLKTKQDDDEVHSQEGEAQGAFIAAKRFIISNTVKTNVIENIIPIIIALKHKLEELKSPLLDDLMSCLRELMKDYKNEVKDILAADKQLATEIEFDLKKWEEEQKKLEAIRESQVFNLFNPNIQTLEFFLFSLCSQLKLAKRRRKLPVDLEKFLLKCLYILYVCF